VQDLFAVDGTAIASFKIVDNGSGTTVMVARDANGQWSLVEPQAQYTDIASVEAAVTQLTSLQVTSSLEESGNLADYGLDKPAYTITVNVNGGGQLVAQVGSPTATSSGYYVQMPGSVPQIIPKYGLDAVLKLLKNPPIATPTSTPTTVITGTLAAPSSTPSSLPVLTDISAPASTATVPPPTSTPVPQATATPLAATPTETAKP
jgi:hypothetical protein